MKKFLSSCFFIILFLIAGAIPQGMDGEAAAASIELVPSLPSPQAVGIHITWTVNVSGISTPVEYRLSVAPPGGTLRVMYDYIENNIFDWVPIDEGTYAIAASAKILATGQIINVPTSYTISSRVTDQPVVTSTENPLIAFYSAPPPSAGNQMRVKFWKSGSTTFNYTTSKPCRPGCSVNFYIAGMMQQSVYSMQHQVLDSSGGVVDNGPILTFNTGSLPDIFPAINVVDPPDDKTCTAQNVVLHEQLMSNPHFPFATDLQGRVLWYISPSIPTHAWRPVDGGTFLGVVQDKNGVNGQILHEFDLLGHTLQETSVSRINEQLAAIGQDPLINLHHESLRLPNGYTAVIGHVERMIENVQGPGPVDILGNDIIVLNENWQVVWVWNSFEHLDVTRKAILGETCQSGYPQGCPELQLSSVANDWLHGNAIAYSSTDGNLIFSIRHQDWIIKIDYRDGAGTGNVIWRLGPDGDFSISSSDPYPWFTHPHDPNFAADNQIAVFDNGNTRCASNSSLCYSRGQVYTIDEKTRTASLYLNANLQVYSGALGSAQPLLNGNFHFNSGWNYVTTPPTFAISDEWLPDGSRTYRLKINSVEYRSFRMKNLYTQGDVQSPTTTSVPGTTTTPTTTTSVPGTTTSSISSPFIVADSSCPKAHCDPQEGNMELGPYPDSNARLLQVDSNTPSRGASLGCSSNGTVVACTFGKVPANYPGQPCDPGIQNTLIVYDYGIGAGPPFRKWDSGSLLNCSASVSVPLVSENGDVITCDDTRIVRYDPSGTVVWDTITPGGLPISPVITENGIIVIATQGGPISAYDNQTGALVGQLDLITATGRYETINTPGVSGNRMYVSMQNSADTTQGRLYAIDVVLPSGYNPAEPATYQSAVILQEAWYVDFGGPSQASPVVYQDMVFFDGDNSGFAAMNPQFFAVKDYGTYGVILWTQDMPANVVASPALDLRVGLDLLGGLWVYSQFNNVLLRLGISDGSIIDQIDVDDLVGMDGVHVPSSIVMVAGTATEPVLILSATGYDAIPPADPTAILSVYMVAINLNTKRPIWKIPLPLAGVGSQFPIAYGDGTGGPRLFFNLSIPGTWAIIGVPTTTSTAGPTTTTTSVAPTTITSSAPGTTTSSVQSTTTTTAPPASCAGVAPSSGYPGTTLDVTITGLYTNFTVTDGVTIASFSGTGISGITVTSTRVKSETEAVATIRIDPGSAPLGTYDVIVATNSETVTCTSAFTVALAPACFPMQSKSDETWIPNGPVYAILPTDSTIYIGGDFTQVGPKTGGGVPIGSSGSVQPPFPLVNGKIRCAVADGKNGWYIGGDFTRLRVQAGGVTSFPRNRIAHILADGSVDPNWNPNASDTVYALAISGDGSTVYAGGDFTSIGGQPRNRLAALDAATGNATAWNPSASNTVTALALSGDSGTVYAGGKFTTIGGQPRNRIAALDAATGNATGWDPSASDTVTALALSGDSSTVYAGGKFTTIGGASRNHIAALDATINNNNATAWNPNASSSSSGTTVTALAISGSTVYAGGYFKSIGGAPRSCIAALDAATGNATAWNPNADNTVYALALSGDGSTVYAGGYFTSIGGQSRNYIAALDATINTNNATAWDPNASNTVYTLAVIGSTVYAGGDFASMGGLTRNRIAEIDATSGNATDWDPSADSTVIALALSGDGSTVYAGGKFTTIGGASRNHIAALDATINNNNATAWNPNASSSSSGTTVTALAISGSTVYAGGYFTSIGGQSRNYIAALDATINTNNATAWDPNASNTVTALALSGDSGTVYAGGKFTTIGGQPRNRLAALDAATGNATDWDPSADSTVIALALSGDGSTVYAGGDFAGIGSQTPQPTRNRLAALDAATGNATGWDPNASDTVTALALSGDGSAVYAGGYFTSIGGTTRNRLAALDAATGNATGWDPNVGVSGQQNYINTLVMNGDGSRVYTGGNFNIIGGALYPFFAQFSSGCTFSIVPDNGQFNAAGGTGSFSVVSYPSYGGCFWSATNENSWVSITAGNSGTGNGTVSYSVEPNAGAVRSGVLTICGQIFTINQAAANTTTTPGGGGGGGGGGNSIPTTVPATTIPVTSTSTTSTTTTVPPRECFVNSDCDDGVFCNGAEKCSNGKCVKGENPCTEKQVCNETLVECWDVVTITAMSLQQSVWRPFFWPSKCLWLVALASEDNHFSAKESRIETVGPGEGAKGVTVDDQSKAFTIGNLLFIPVCIERGATVGQWSIMIETDVQNISVSETIVTNFLVK